MKKTEKQLLDERLTHLEENLQRAQRQVERAQHLLHEVAEELAKARADVTQITDQVEGGDAISSPPVDET